MTPESVWSAVQQKRTDNTEYKTIRSRLTRVVILPSVVLLGMWALFSGYLIYEGFYVRAVAVEVKSGSIPAVNALVALQKERQLAMLTLSQPNPDVVALQAQRKQTDTAVGELSAKLDSLAAGAPDVIVERVRKLKDLLGQLPQQRAQVGATPEARVNSYNYYNSVLDAGSDLFDTQARVVPDAAAGQAGLTASQIFRAADDMSRAASLGAGGLATGQFGTKDHLAFANLVGAYHAQLSNNIPAAQPDVQAKFDDVNNGDAMKRLIGYESDFVEHGAEPQRNGHPAFNVTLHDWQTTTDQVSEQLIGVAIAQAAEAADLGIANGSSRFTEVSVGSLIALLAVIFGIVLAVRNSRRLVDGALVTRLAALRADALQLARERLPDIMRRLSDGEHVDVDREVPPLDYGQDEIGQVADAFNVAQFTAVSAAVKESQARDGIAKVFLGIARRNQVLVHRQLKIIDGMERKEDKPERLDTLFQLDHLATRARRNAENLIILAGEKPGRQWRKPVRLVDILRAAVAETEQYTRLRVNPVPMVTIVGAAVADSIHLLAELMDNATSFSSPRSQVEVHASVTPQGVLVEIEDRGLGMSREDREEHNALLANPPKFDDITLRGDPRLGLFVVAQLAGRRGVSVQLRPAMEGGTLAVALLPPDLVDSQPQPDMLSDPADLTAGSSRRAATVNTEVEPSLSNPSMASEPHPDEVFRTVTGEHRDPINGSNHYDHGAEFDGGSFDHMAPRANGFDLHETDRPFNTPIQQHARQHTRPPLPRRRRQQSLAPQLRGELLPEPTEEPVEPPVSEPNPERTGGNLAAFQRGTREARRIEDQRDT